jgi:hypothetical protein
MEAASPAPNYYCCLMFEAGVFFTIKCLHLQTNPKKAPCCLEGAKAYIIK